MIIKESLLGKRTAVLLICTAALIISSCASQQVAGGKSYKAPYKKSSKNSHGRVYTVNGETYSVMPSSDGYLEIGVASWYGKKFHGRLTANGEIYDMYKMSAAHKSLPLPSLVKITNLDNGEKIVVRVNDRGPFHDNRLIDLSYQAAIKLGFADKGTAPVVVEALRAVPTISTVSTRGEEENFTRGEDKKMTRQTTGKINSITPPVTTSTTLATTMPVTLPLAYPKTVQKTIPATHRGTSPMAGLDNMSYYLQIGAFTHLKSARQLMDKIDLLIGSHGVVDVNVRILQSELPQKMLHKVWIGPVRDQSKRDLIALWVQELNLGNPIKVDID